MDCKYIEQLLERYWQCETSLLEEEELRAFFQQEDIPAHLLRERDLFIYQLTQQEVTLGDDFDKRILAQIEPAVKAKRLTFVGRFAPLFKAAAVVAMLFMAGNIVQQSLFSDKLDYNYDAYTDTYNDPEAAYKQVSSALMMLSEGMNKSQDQHVADSLKAAEVNMINE